MTFWPKPKHPKARTQHYCDMCNRIIHVGETYKCAAGLGDGTAWTWKECAHCEALLRVHPEILDWAEEGYCGDNVTEWEPRTFIGLLRQARYRKQWRHSNGDLAAIPTEVAA